jgi:hypothetical protein
MSDVMVAFFLALAAQDAKLREQLASAQNMLVDSAINAGNMHALLGAMRIERDEPEQSRYRPASTIP